MNKPLSLLFLLLLSLLVACNTPSSGNPNQPASQPKAVADTYTFTQGALSLVAKDKGVLINDSVPATYTLSVATKPQHGTLELNPDGSFSYQHDGSEPANDGFGYTLVASGVESTAEVTLKIEAAPSDAPVANADAYTLDEGATLTVAVDKGVLVNDTNPLASSLVATVQTQPQHGTLTLKEDGSFIYVHDNSETTTDGFIYSVSNGAKTAQANAVLTINPVDDAPVLSKLELAQTHLIPAEGKSWSATALANYNLHLVGGREALVLVELTSGNKRIANPVLEAYAAGQKLGEVVLNTPSTLPPTEAKGPAYSTTAYWAKLDKTWVKVGLELKVRANEGQYTAVKAVKVGAPTEFTLYTLPFYLFGLTESAVPLSQTAAPDAATQDEYFAKHPFSKLNMLNHPAQKIVWPYIIVGPRQGRPAQKVEYKEQQGDGFAVMSAVLNTLGAIRGANGDSPTANQYYAPLLMANQAGAYSGPGGGLGGGHIGTGDYSYTGVFIHEQGHAFGMPHANDGYTTGNYPYIGGSVKGSSWGFDQKRNEFLGTFVPTTASTYKTCATGGFPMGRQLDDQGRCVKQDPMQSGSGDQASGYKFTMFSDFNAAVVQQYLEGTTTISSGKHSYSGGRIFVDPASATGYSRWDSLDNQFVPFSTATTSGGLYGFDQGLPIQRGVPVYTIVMTASLSSIQDTFTEKAGETHLTFSDTVNYDANLTQIYPPIPYTGNLMRIIDPTNAAQLASIVPNTSENYWYCRNSGCDYTLRVTYADDTQQYRVLQGGFKGWFSSDIPSTANDPTNGDSYHVWGINIPANKALKKLELLETPEVWKGLPTSPRVVATRTVN